MALRPIQSGNFDGIVYEVVFDDTTHELVYRVAGRETRSLLRAGAGPRLSASDDLAMCTQLDALLDGEAVRRAIVRTGRVRP